MKLHKYTNTPQKKLVVLALVLWTASLALPAYSISDNPDTSTVPGWFCLLMGWSSAISLPGIAWLANIPFFIAASRLFRDRVSAKTMYFAGAASIMSLFALTFNAFPVGDLSRTAPATPAIGCFVWIASAFAVFLASSPIFRRI